MNFTVILFSTVFLAALAAFAAPGAQPSSRPQSCNFTCPDKNTDGHPLVSDHVSRCIYENDAFCTYSESDGALVRGSPGCHKNAIRTCTSRGRNALPRSPHPASPAASAVKPNVMKVRSQLKKRAELRG